MRVFAIATAVAGGLAWAPASICPRSATSRAAVLMEVKSWHDAGLRLEDSESVSGGGGLAVAPTAGKRPKLTLNQQINRQIVNADDSEAVLCLVEKHAESLNCINIATALHRIAARNKHKRARRDSLVRDRRFLLLEDALAASGTSAKAQSIDGAARSVADVLWSYATLGSLPPKLLTPGTRQHGQANPSPKPKHKPKPGPDPNRNPSPNPTQCSRACRCSSSERASRRTTTQRWCGRWASCSASRCDCSSASKPYAYAYVYVYA